MGKYSNEGSLGNASKFTVHPSTPRGKVAEVAITCSSQGLVIMTASPSASVLNLETVSLYIHSK